MSKTRVIVIYGGRSTEHEVSCRSAAFVLRNLDQTKYDVQAVAIDKSGAWIQQDTRVLLNAVERGEKFVPIIDNGATQKLMAPGKGAIAPDVDAGRLTSGSGSSGKSNRDQTVVFPVLHGTFGEDGSIQGFFDLGEIAYVGPGVLGSAIGMDKVVAKKLAAAAGIPVVPWIDFRREDWAQRKATVEKDVVKAFGFPVFVKPATLGSSVGVSKVTDATRLLAACEHAFQFDDRLLIEKGLDVREIECAMLGTYEAEASIPGEVIPHADFYSYEAKYISADGASMAIPARLTEQQTKEAQSMAKQIFSALELYGMARVDLFLEKSTDRFYFNEVNTIPGFTEISQYPMLWRESGLNARNLLDKLIELALRRKEAKAGLKRSVS